MRLLVVEDDDVIGGTLEQALTRDGYDVDWVRDGQRGLDMAREHPYAAVVLDLMLPKMNGFEMCRKLREVNVATPILMLRCELGYWGYELLKQRIDD